ncbi:DNA polymerase III subunit delta' [Alkalibacterium olivapovliticus]|uniref:DNA polymerase-3 subunit delta n=1 Tax=Alkalibacterium olivapovliticus TaxID=99907 RepID=A0A2T0W798_9LACT|nr:DNA polymerase III subunit delta' [Alkalibacterium olivapovliticus]PRY82572.1 DNA polymerase-3 subunit delta' [Alkalibacterium olivapovliticus]
MSTQTNRQPSIQRLFLQLLKKNRLQHAYIFEGKAGTGKKEMAMWITQSLYCPQNEHGACQSCETCRRIAEHHHPDVLEIEPDGQSIKIGQVRALKEEFTKSGMESRRKLVIVKDAEKMTNQAANSLLKFLEEPDGDITVFLLTTAKHRLLSTILSRSQLIHFPQLPKLDRIQTLVDNGLSKEKAAILVHLTSDANEAEELAGKEELTQLIQTVWKWYTFISKKDDQAFVYVHTDLMSLAKEKADQYLVLDLMLILLQDVLNSQVSEDYSFAFTSQQDDLKKDAAILRPLTIAKMMEVILTGKKQLDSNVAAQGIFEDCSLQLIAIVKEGR